MRLDARNGDIHWTVYHAEECRELKQVVWVDDVTNEYGVYGARAGGEELPTITYRVRKVEIYPSRRLVIINPVEDHESEPVSAIATVPLLIES